MLTQAYLSLNTNFFCSENLCGHVRKNQICAMLITNIKRRIMCVANKGSSAEKSN